MEKKQQSSVFQVFILKNKLKKTEIAQYLGVSNAFINNPHFLKIVIQVLSINQNNYFFCISSHI